MEFQKVLETRRSVRNYDLSKVVDQQTLKELLEAVRLAPSWKNSQTSRYYCVCSEDIRKRIIQDCLPAFNGNSVKNAPVLIVSAFVKNCSGFERNGEPTNEIGNGWGFYDLGLHDQNLLLKATDLVLFVFLIDTPIFKLNNPKYLHFNHNSQCTLCSLFTINSVYKIKSPTAFVGDFILC